MALHRAGGSSGTAGSGREARLVPCQRGALNVSKNLIRTIASAGFMLVVHRQGSLFWAGRGSRGGTSARRRLLVAVNTIGDLAIEVVYVSLVVFCVSVAPVLAISRQARPVGHVKSSVHSKTNAIRLSGILAVVNGPRGRRFPALVAVVLIKNASYLGARRAVKERGRQRNEEDGGSTVKCKMASRNGLLFWFWDSSRGWTNYTSPSP